MYVYICMSIYMYILYIHIYIYIHILYIYMYIYTCIIYKYKIVISSFLHQFCLKYPTWQMFRPTKKETVMNSQILL